MKIDIVVYAYFKKAVQVLALGNEEKKTTMKMDNKAKAKFGGIKLKIKIQQRTIDELDK